MRGSRDRKIGKDLMESVREEEEDGRKISIWPKRPRMEREKKLNS